MSGRGRAQSFIADDKFDDVIRELRDVRGWRACGSENDPFFDLKWRNLSKTKFQSVRPHQIVNHLQHAERLSN